MKFSLIMATLGRIQEIEDFIKSLLIQEYEDYELIIVDQNEHMLVKEIVESYKNEINIKYIRSDVKGISVNRNIGLKVATGDILAFPDDDCEYSPELLKNIILKFKNSKELDIVSVNTLEKGKNYGIGKMPDRNCELLLSNILETVKSITVFLKNNRIKDLLFDERLGAGKKYGSGEETDFLLHCLHIGLVGRYFPELVVYHPAKKGDYLNTEREFKYALGFGALCRKEIFIRKNYMFILIFIKKTYKNFLGSFFSRNREYHYTILKGKLLGLLNY